MHKPVYFYFSYLLLWKVLFCNETPRVNSEDPSNSSFLKTIDDLFKMFDLKRVAKSNPISVQHYEAVSSQKLLKENLKEDMLTLQNTQLIEDPEAGKLFAILENIEAIEINLKMADEFEKRANQGCSIYFPEIEEIVSDSLFKKSPHLSFLISQIENFKHVNFEKTEWPGLFMTKELSRNMDIEEDSRIMGFVIQNLNRVLDNQHGAFSLGKTNKSEIYSLPNDEYGETKKKVIKVMTFSKMFEGNLKENLQNEEPILDALLMMAKSKRKFFEQISREIKLNSVTNNFKQISNYEILENNPLTNLEVGNFYGCLNLRWQANSKKTRYVNIIQKIKRAYLKQMETPNDIRDLTFEDLQDLLSQVSIDLSKGTQKLEITAKNQEQREIVLKSALIQMKIYQDYKFVFVFDRMDLDSFDDTFQKIYFLNASSLEQRLNLFLIFTSKVLKLHEQGFFHCDISSSNFLFKINGGYSLKSENFRLIDFKFSMFKTRFCKGGTTGYLAPEIQDPLQLPLSSAKFLEQIKFLDDLISSQSEILNLEAYEDLVGFLFEHHGISIPEDYIDFRIVVQNGSFNRPSTFKNWLQLLTHLSEIFKSLGIIPKIYYQPQIQDVREGSSQLKYLSSLKGDLDKANNQVKLSKQEIRDKIAAKKSHDFQTGKGPFKVVRLDHTQIFKNKWEQVANTFNQKTETTKIMDRNSFIVRMLTRRKLQEGVFNFDENVIEPLAKADTFSLGIFFNEMETALNSHSIFENFKLASSQGVSPQVFENQLVHPMENTLKMKINRAGLNSTLKQKVQCFFKDHQDMQVSYNQYSSEYKIFNGPNMNDFSAILKDLNQLILKMTAFFAFDRPSMFQVQQHLLQFQTRLGQIKKQDKMYGNKINNVNKKIRETVVNLFKIKQKELDKEEIILI